MTDDEQRIPRLMAAARGGQGRTIALGDVLGRDVSPRLQTAARTVALILDEVSHERVARAPRPPAVAAPVH